MKQSIAVLVDGENISYRRPEEIARLCGCMGRIFEMRVYHRQKDEATRPWTEVSAKAGYRDIRLFGAPRKNMVDSKMMRDALRYARRPEIGGVCIVSSDSDFAAIADAIREMKKRMIFIGEEKAPERLRHAGDRFEQLKA